MAQGLRKLWGGLVPCLSTLSHTCCHEVPGAPVLGSGAYGNHKRLKYAALRILKIKVTQNFEYFFQMDDNTVN